MVHAPRRSSRKYRGEHHVRLYGWLLRSQAWRSLSAQSRAVLICLMDRYNGSNNGRIALSVRSAAAECRITKDTAARAFHELQDRGFIKLVTPGAFSRKVRHAAEWLLTEFRDDVSGDMPTKEFMCWRQNQNSVPIQAVPVPSIGTVVR